MTRRQMLAAFAAVPVAALVPVVPTPRSGSGFVTFGPGTLARLHGKEVICRFDKNPKLFLQIWAAEIQKTVDKLCHKHPPGTTFGEILVNENRSVSSAT